MRYAASSDREGILTCWHRAQHHTESRSRPSTPGNASRLLSRIAKAATSLSDSKYGLVVP